MALLTLIIIIIFLEFYFYSDMCIPLVYVYNIAITMETVVTSLFSRNEANSINRDSCYKEEGEEDQWVGQGDQWVGQEKWQGHNLHQQEKQLVAPPLEQEAERMRLDLCLKDGVSGSSVHHHL